MQAKPVRVGGRGRALALVAILGVLVVVTVASVRIGSVSMSNGTVLDAFVDYDPSSSEHIIIRTIRLPRTVMGIGVGAALGVAGAVMQAVTRNALASPEILGVNAGAAFAIVTAVHLFGIVSPAGYVWFAFGGAFAAMVLVHLIGSAGRGGATPVKLALAGAVLTALLASWVWAILVLDQETLDSVRFWLAGSLAERELSVFVQVAPLIVVGILASLSLCRELNAMSLGEDLARSLGQRTARVRAVAAVATVLLAGSAVAVAGPIAFVGLAVPHAVRALVGPDYRWVLPYAAVVGPILLLAADVVGRVVVRPSELQVGIVTAVLGAPFLVVLVRGKRLAAV
jgi:iron complex transport system permease protein